MAAGRYRQPVEVPLIPGAKVMLLAFPLAVQISSIRQEMKVSLSKYLSFGHIV
jgi:hypothetical protein